MNFLKRNAGQPCTSGMETLKWRAWGGSEETADAAYRRKKKI